MLDSRRLKLFSLWWLTPYCAGFLVFSFIFLNFSKPLSLSVVHFSQTNLFYFFAISHSIAKHFSMIFPNFFIVSCFLWSVFWSSFVSSQSSCIKWRNQNVANFKVFYWVLFLENVIFFRYKRRKKKQLKPQQLFKNIEQWFECLLIWWKIQFIQIIWIFDRYTKTLDKFSSRKFCIFNQKSQTIVFKSIFKVHLWMSKEPSNREALLRKVVSIRRYSSEDPHTIHKQSWSRMKLNEWNSSSKSVAISLLIFRTS